MRGQSARLVATPIPGTAGRSADLAQGDPVVSTHRRCPKVGSRRVFTETFEPAMTDVEHLKEPRPCMRATKQMSNRRSRRWNLVLPPLLRSRLTGRPCSAKWHGAASSGQLSILGWGASSSRPRAPSPADAGPPPRSAVGVGRSAPADPPCFAPAPAGPAPAPEGPSWSAPPVGGQSHRATSQRTFTSGSLASVSRIGCGAPGLDVSLLAPATPRLRRDVEGPPLPRSGGRPLTAGQTGFRETLWGSPLQGRKGPPLEHLDSLPLPSRSRSEIGPRGQFSIAGISSISSAWAIR